MAVAATSSAEAAAAAAQTSQAAQTTVAIAAGRLVEQAFATLNVSDLQQSLPRFQSLIAAIVRRYGHASASAAVLHYRQQRAAAGISSPVTLRPTAPPTLTVVREETGWATAPLWSKTPNIELAREQVQAASERMVLDTGRNTIIDNVQNDRAAKAWARITEPDPCYFCALLASRGAVYSRDTVGFQPHDHCRCHAEPVFTAYEPTAQIRGWQQLYKDSTARQADKLNAFRRAYEQKHPPKSHQRSAATTKPGGPRKYRASDRTAVHDLLRQSKGSTQTFHRLLTEAGIDPSSVPNGAL